MKVLLDHNLDRRLKGDLPGHETATTYECGWADLSNGELLSAAEAAEFDVLMTADSNIVRQQNIGDRRISILVLRAYNNRRSTQLEMISEVLQALDLMEKGTFLEIIHPAFQRGSD